MKISFLIPAIVLNVVGLAFSNNVQVGTVLFSTSDLVKRCWTDYDKSLLRARAIMQDVLPDPDCLDFSNPEAIVTLLDYFHACYQIISTSTYGRVQNLLFAAMSDAFGGYLRAHVLPYTRKSYYAGMAKYAEVKKLFLLYDDIKKFLKTDGIGWAAPSQPDGLEKIRVNPLDIKGGEAEACKDLFIIETEGKPYSMDPVGESERRNLDDIVPKSSRQNLSPLDVLRQSKSKKPRKSSPLSSFHNAMRREERQLNDYSDSYPYPNGSRLLQKHFQHVVPHSDEFHLEAYLESPGTSPKPQERTHHEEPCKEKLGMGGLRKEEVPKLQASARIKAVIVPMPMLDDQEAPNSIAVPFKERPLRSLKAESSAFVLERYYISAISCLIAKGNTRNDIKNFNAQFHGWLTSKVVPHLSEEQWYPGFGGVLRVLETIKLLGMQNTYKGGEYPDYGFLFEEGQFALDPTFSRKGCYNTEDFGNLEKETTPLRRYLVTYALVSSLTVFFVLFCCLIYWISNVRRKPRKDEQPDQQKKKRGLNLFFLRGFTFKICRVKQQEESQFKCCCTNCKCCCLVGQEEKKTLETDNKEPVASTTQDRRVEDEEKAVIPSENLPPMVPQNQGPISFYWQNTSARDVAQNKKRGRIKRWNKKRGERKLRYYYPAYFLTHHSKSPFEQPRHPHNVHTLWKKPSNPTHHYWTSAFEGLQRMEENPAFSVTGSDGLGYNIATIEDETKYHSSELATICHCTESCHCTILTDSSITAKEQKRKPSSVTFFERRDEVNLKGRVITRSSTQSSIMESGSEDFYSSECSLSPRSLRKHRRSKNYP